MTATTTITEFIYAGFEFQLDVEFDYTVSRYYPGDWLNPPEGGEVEITSARVTDVRCEPGRAILSVFGPDVIRAFDKRFKAGLWDDEFIELAVQIPPAEYEE